jgi:hypothetical protein
MAKNKESNETKDSVKKSGSVIGAKKEPGSSIPDAKPRVVRRQTTDKPFGRKEIIETVETMIRTSRQPCLITVSYIIPVKSVTTGKKTGKTQIMTRAVSLMERKDPLSKKVCASLPFVPAVGDKIHVPNLFLFDGTAKRSNRTFYVTERSYTGYEDNDLDNFTGIDITDHVRLVAVEEKLLPWWKRLMLKRLEHTLTK